MPRTEKEDSAPASGGSQRRNNKKNNSRRGGNNVVVAESKADNGPDPRWAQDLAKLKEMLAAQTTPS